MAALAPSAAGAADPKLRFAVIEVGGSQQRVCANDLIMVPSMSFAAIGDVLTFQPLLVGSLASTVIGRPHVANVVVRARVEEHTDGAKVIIFKKKRRTGYKRTTGFRAQYTVLRVTSIEDVATVPKAKSAEVAASSPSTSSVSATPAEEMAADRAKLTQSLQHAEAVLATAKQRTHTKAQLNSRKFQGAATRVAVLNSVQQAVSPIKVDVQGEAPADSEKAAKAAL